MAAVIDDLDKKNRAMAVYLKYEYYNEKHPEIIALKPKDRYIGWKRHPLASNNPGDKTGIRQDFLSVDATFMRFHTSWDWLHEVWDTARGHVNLLKEYPLYPREQVAAIEKALVSGTKAKAHEAIYLLLVWIEEIKQKTPG